MKVLLDADLSHLVARELRARGRDATAITERDDLPGNAPDEIVMEIAASEGRAVVTANVKDFRPIAAQRLMTGRGHPGLILVSAATPRTKASAKRLADAVERVMLENPGGLAGSERWIDRGDSAPPRSNP